MLKLRAAVLCGAVALAAVLGAAAAPPAADAVPRAARGRRPKPAALRGGRPAGPPTFGRWVLRGTKLDLPDPGAPAGRRTGGFSAGNSVRGHGPSDGLDAESFAYGVGLWGTSYLAKKELEERLQSGKTLPAPVWRRKNLSLMLLLPFDRQRLELRAVPVGGLMRVGIINSAPLDDVSR